MGYDTDFSGTLLFLTELTASQIVALKDMCGEDCRDHPEWGAKDLTYISLELNDTLDGLRWDGSEKTYDLVEKVNLVIQMMQLRWPDFALAGRLTAQGEERDDRWILEIGQDGWAHKRAIPIYMSGTEVTCPHCRNEFNLPA